MCAIYFIEFCDEMKKHCVFFGNTYAFTKSPIQTLESKPIEVTPVEGNDEDVEALSEIKNQFRDKKSWRENMPLWGKRSENNVATQRIKKRGFLVMTPHEYHGKLLSKAK